MTVLAAAVSGLVGSVHAAARAAGFRIDADLPSLVDRSDSIKLGTPGLISANGSCRLLKAADGWIALNLPRQDDRALIPAWIGCDDTDGWTGIADAVARRSSASLVTEAVQLGLAAASAGETRCADPFPPLLKVGAAAAHGQPISVIDLSSLWAGPLCGAILAAAGATVIKVESLRRPDSTPSTMPRFDARLNGAKQRTMLDFTDEAGRKALRDLLARADVVISSARPRAFDGLGISPTDLFARKPGLIWIAITAHGWRGEAGMRIGFGDDAAASGGLLRWTAGGEPRFLGDAAADPLTGLAAAKSAFDALAEGGGVLVDAALARTAAGIVAQHR